MYFCSSRQFHNGRNNYYQYGEKRNSPMFYCLVFFHMTRFRYFSVGECPQFICFKPVLNSDVNLVKGRQICIS